MRRRFFLGGAVALPLISPAVRDLIRASSATPFTRVRPGDPGWPTASAWSELGKQVGGRLRKLESPLAACRAAPDGAACTEFFQNLKNPFFVGDDPALSQTTGWIGAWAFAPSTWVVAAENAADVAAAVNFARTHRLRLVVKGGGHSYKGTSSSADSLLIWTRAMKQVDMHDAFVPLGCDGKVAATPAVSVGSGAIWGQVYYQVGTVGGRYVQGGGCTTVGVAGLIQSGGFGSFSKNYGTACAALLEAEIVTADGRIRVVNQCNDPELFWALKGGGGGTFGVVTRVTLRTRELPETFGGAGGRIKARSDAAYARLVAYTLRFYRDHLWNPHWGEQIEFVPDGIKVSMVFQGLSTAEANDTWQPFRDWLAASPDDFEVVAPLGAVGGPANHFWDGEFLQKMVPGVITHDSRPGAPAGNWFWTGDKGQAGDVVTGYRSAWLPAALLDETRIDALAATIVSAAQIWDFALHFNKGLAGAPAAELAAARDTAMNPAVLDAFALVIIAGMERPAIAGVPGHEPDVASGKKDAAEINQATEQLLALAPGAGSYLSESDFFGSNWKDLYWGPNYPRLAAAKRKYDPDGLFFVHQGVGSEQWSADGFRRIS